MTRRRFLVPVVLGCLVLGGCGVDDEPEPVPLTEAPVAPAAVPTVTQRPDPAPDPSTPDG
ncbi:hypothetical protein [Pseudonocardia hydrocarbonoxydans]|uniref:Uncharacterized protein n=1 Tax=Pseudonocardia hydrocarbonoxydans TaxID=76726 RepID=A0A4Y3WJU7_9PSEU|nr:hypothetical protein [Pseudonocardia hydrocarbonoxydans]GEC19222.1 hypothetical protein PHY01_15050 [Pseudonocardia hydrocarbonoxydans]